MSKKPSQPTSIRLPEELQKTIRLRAAADNRSMSSLIVQVLCKKFKVKP